MRIMTVRQPWAWAIIHGGKTVENRSRNLAGSYRGPVAIHAAATTVASFDSRHPDLWPFDLAKHKFGAIIGVVDLVDVHHARDTRDSMPCGGLDEDYGDAWCSPWAEPDGYHLVLANPRPLSEPIPYKGALGLREVPADLLARIEAAL